MWFTDSRRLFAVLLLLISPALLRADWKKGDALPDMKSFAVEGALPDLAGKVVASGLIEMPGKVICKDNPERSVFQGDLPCIANKDRNLVRVRTGGSAEKCCTRGKIKRSNAVTFLYKSRDSLAVPAPQLKDTARRRQQGNGWSASAPEPPAALVFPFPWIPACFHDKYDSFFNPSCDSTRIISSRNYPELAGNRNGRLFFRLASIIPDR